MAVYTLEEAKQNLAYWNAQLRLAAERQESWVEGRRNTRGDMRTIRREVEKWEGIVANLSRTRPRSFQIRVRG